jgi:hypothetical protein
MDKKKKKTICCKCSSDDIDHVRAFHRSAKPIQYVECRKCSTVKVLK